MQENFILALILRILQVSRIWMITGTFKTFFPITVVYFSNQEVCSRFFDFISLMNIYPDPRLLLYLAVFFLRFIKYGNSDEGLLIQQKCSEETIL